MGYINGIWMGYEWDINGILMGLPSGYVKIAIENGHLVRGFSHWNMVIFHSYVSLSEGTVNHDTWWLNLMKN